MKIRILGWGLMLLWAQGGKPPAGVSRKAYDKYLEAVRAAQNRQESTALQLLEEVLRIEPEYEEALVFKAKLHLRRQDYGALLETGGQLERTKSISPTGKALGLYFQGKAYMAMERYDSAYAVWQRFLLNGYSHVPRAIQEEGALLYGQSKHAAALVKKPVPFFPQNMGPAVNSAYDDYLPSLTADGQKLYFTSRRPSGARPPNPLRGGYDEDLYWSERMEGGEWSPARPVGPPINSPQNEGAAFFSSDGQWAFITLCDRPDGKGSCDIYFSELKGLEWAPPKNLTEINTSAWESHPCLTHDRRRLYFASSRPGGIGGVDIWYSDWKDGRWQPPVNLGRPINTPGDEYSPMIAADGRTLYFASNYHPGMGGQDLFLSFLSDTGWTTPRNLGYPLNTPADEQTLCLDARGEIGFIALERKEGLGKTDIYEFRLWPDIRPLLRATYVKGKVYDEESGSPVGAFVAVIDIERRDTIRSLTANEATGEFLFSLPLGKRYGLFAKAPGYLFYSGHFDLSEGDSIYHLRVPLQRIKAGGRLVLRNIFFDFDKADLRPESEVELQEVLRLLQANPTWHIQIEGHTDSIGSAAYNLNLSERRAQAVRNYLVQKGISAQRLIARGFGATRPVASNATEAGRALNRRTEILFIQSR
ncbi:MAG: OmpA family protein [Bacteroidia bacterium]|nr:OmpA family protein [Bacteroidia bacterium]MDW8235654.1 OmpA family protein [Bacteroidia bacterium]